MWLAVGVGFPFEIVQSQLVLGRFTPADGRLNLLYMMLAHQFVHLGTVEPTVGVHLLHICTFDEVGQCLR